MRLVWTKKGKIIELARPTGLCIRNKKKQKIHVLNERGFFTATGAFFVLACLTALQNKLKMPSATNVEGGSEIRCGGNCASCAGDVCAANHGLIEAQKAAEKAEAARLKAEKAKAAKEEANKKEV